MPMLAKGAAWHDGVVVTEVTPGSLGRMEAKAASTLTEPVAGAYDLHGRSQPGQCSGRFG